MVQRIYTPTTKENRACHDYFLDLLDFKPATQVRERFRANVKQYLAVPHRKYLRKEDGEKFSASVQDFLVQHGAEFFGKVNRSHLVEPKPSIGLLYPRDAKDETS